MLRATTATFHDAKMRRFDSARPFCRRCHISSAPMVMRQRRRADGRRCEVVVIAARCARGARERARTMPSAEQINGSGGDDDDDAPHSRVRALSRFACARARAPASTRLVARRPHASALRSGDCSPNTREDNDAA